MTHAHDAGAVPAADSGAPNAAEPADSGATSTGGAGAMLQADAGAPSAIDDVPWDGSSAPLGAGSWHAAERIDRAGNEGGFGSASYSPAGDLYVFYSVLAAPESLMVMRRVSGEDTWSSETQVAMNGRTSHAAFVGTTLYAAIENHGTALVYHSTDQGASWTWEASFSGKDNGAETAFNQAFLVAMGADLALYFGYTYFDSVVGSEHCNPYRVTKHGSDWAPQPASIAASTLVEDLQGAYGDDAHHVLVLASGAFRSDDDGKNFSRLHASELGGIVAAARNEADGSVVIANQVGGASEYTLTLWGTRDLGTRFSRLATFRRKAAFGKVALALTKNRAAVAVTTDQGRGDAVVSVATSTDEGTTWSDWTDLVDVTAAGDQLNAISLAAGASGSIALVYSVERNGTRKGVFLRELD